jgi:hypothetical protein
MEYNNFENIKGTDLEDVVFPGGNEEERARNRILLSDYDIPAYGEALSGYFGQQLQVVEQVSRKVAVRTRVGTRGNYKAGMARLADGTLIIASCRPLWGTNGPYDVVFHILVYRSGDNGETWEEIGKTDLLGKEPSLCALPDGTLIMTAQLIESGHMTYTMPLYRSTDGGITWTKDIISGTSRDYPRNIFLDSDGSVCFVRTLDHRYEFENEKTTESPNLEVFRSFDSGVTWQRSIGVIDWNYAGIMEVCAIRSGDGRMLATIRHQPSGTFGEGFENTLFSESSDNGKTWSKPFKISGTGEPHFYLTELSDGRLLATYSHYHVPYGIAAMLSSDGGKTWDRNNFYQLAHSHDAYTGWPVTIELPDGSLVTSYAITNYCEQKPYTTSCETIRWRL